MLKITRQNKRETGLETYFPKTFGARVGYSGRALHPTIRGSNPLRSKYQYIKFLGGLQ